MLDLESLNCNCTLPCEQELYQPSLSYAQLSRHTITQLVLTDSHKEAVLYRKFMTAREAAQHVFEHVRSEDDLVFGELTNASLTYQQKLEDSIDILENATKFEMEFPNLVPFPNTVRHVLATDTVKLEKVREYQTMQTYFSPKGTFQLKEWYNGVTSKVLDRSAQGYELLTNLYICRNVTGHPENDTMLECDNKEANIRKGYFSEKKADIKRKYEQCAVIKGYIKANAEKYDEVVFALFNDTSLNPYTYTEHLNMLELLESMNNSINAICEGLEILTGEYPLDDAIEAAHLITGNVDPWGSDEENLIYDSLIQGRWIHNVLRAKPVYEDLRGVYQVWETPVADTEFFLLKIKEHLLDVQKHYLTNIHVTLKHIEAYKKRQMTKLQLAVAITDRKMLKSLDILDDLHSDLNSKITGFERKLLYELVFYMDKMYRSSFNISIPLYNMTVLNTLELVKQAERVENNTGLIDQLKYLQESPADGLLGIIDVMTRDYR